MSTADLVADLSRLGVGLWADGDQLRFRAPQGVLTPELRAKLVEHKGDLLEFLRHVQTSVQFSAIPPIRPTPRQDVVPLSYAQERLWFADQWEPGGAAYNIFDAILVEGRIEPEALEKSLNEIARRHEILRTTFAVSDGQPVQRIAPAAAVALRVIDLRHLPAPDRDDERRRLMSEEAARPFDLARGPLWRVALFRLEDARHALLFNMHHIVSDGWSTGVLIGEMVSLYRAFTAGRPSPLPELPIQYADFALWQRQWAEGERLESERAFWKEQLRGAPASLDLPADRPRPPARTSLGATHYFSLPPSLSSEVRRFGQQGRFTPFMVLLAAWKVLLWKYSGQDDIVVGAPHANRNRTEVEGLIGFFVNTLVLRTDLSANPSFLDLLERVREVTLAAQAHQDLPFEKLVDALQPERDLSRTPVFQVAFAFQNAPTTEMTAPGLHLRRLQLPTGTSKFDLTLTITDAEPSMPAEIEYSAELFDPTTIARMAGHFETLLAHAVAQPGRRISELPVLSAAERHQLITGWNATRAEYPRGNCVQQLFERQAEERPEAIALVCGQQRVSYQELNRKANQLAHYLRGLGVGPEVRVGICLERSLELIVGLLGILKAGGAYVPLDPEYPAERLTYMLADAHASVLLTRSGLLSKVAPDVEGPADHLELPSLVGDRALKLVCVDAVERESIGRQSEENTSPGLTADNLAYVIYTSGSTGRPKGVALQHRGLVNLITWHRRFYSLTPDDRATLVASVSFDASVWELWPYLTTGAGVHIVPEEQRVSPDKMVEWLSRHQITHSFLPTPLAEAVLEQTWPASVKLKVLLTGGDQLRKRPRAGVPFKVVNHYGPTEVTVVTTCGEVEAAAEGSGADLPGVGRPIANTQVYILDAYLQPVPVGVPGELCVAGDGLARCYLNSPQLTAEKFMPDPFDARPGARMYRTGDLARYLPNAQIEFLGRIDHQVKVRGFRIELGEIAAVLSNHTAIEQAVVVARGSEAGDKQLVAYLVAKEGDGPAVADLRSYLKQQLPDYMIPSAFVLLEQLPLTVNGKVDRRALPAPEKAAAAQAYVSPRTLTEELLAGIWADLLRVERVGLRDNFFEAGGHSLLATQVMSRIGDNFHVSLPLKTLFEAPTVAELAERIEHALVSGDDSEAPPIRPVSREKPLPLSFAQENLWLFEQLAPGTPTYNTCRSGRIWGPLNTSAVEAAFNELLQRHEVLRTSYALVDGAPVQVIHPHRHYAVPIIDLGELPEAEREAEAFRLSNEDAQLPIDLTESPVARAKLLRLGQEEHVFILSIHHIAYDLWSGGVLLEEIEHAYLTHARGERPSLPPLPVQYADFGAWQRNWLQGETLGRQLSYWKDNLAGLSAAPMELPTDRPQPAVGAMRGASEYPKFSQSVNEAIKALARRENVTQFMALLAVFQVLLHRYTGQDDIVVGSVIANRNRVELEGVVGFFDNTIVLRADASGDPSFREFLRRVRDVALGAYANQHLPFDILVKELQPERTSTRTPLIQAMFVFLLNYPAMEREIAGLKVVPYNLHSGKARFDLTFGLRESPRGLEGELAYNCDLFDATTITRMCQHFGRLLEAVVADPERRLSELPMLTESERQQLLVEWNETRRQYPAGKCVQELFEEQAARTPEAVALACEGEQLTFNQLNARANQVAHYLRERGVGADVRVGVCLERSVDMLVGVLGVLKAGGAYVPLDASYPRERLAYMVEDSGVSVLLTKEQTQASGAEASAERVHLDADWERIARESTANPEIITGAGNLAYVIYTSGSTGRPKGVMVEHASVVNLSRALHAAIYANYQSPLRVGLNAPLAFDASVKQWLQLLDGHALHILPEDVRADAPALLSYIRRNGLNVLDCTPSHLKVLLAAGLGQGREPAPMLVLAGGEMLDEAAWARLAECDGIDFYNVYGPTECTVDATAQRVLMPGKPTIGRPLANAQVYVLDGGMNPVPVGVPGELYVGGAGLARGYLNQPGLTAEKFTPNPFSSTPGTRLYRTGDRVRWLPDGTLEILGRIDQQVKVRGFRIEPGEIEAVLSSHPSVREAAVVAREDGAGGQRLVAYVVPGGESSPNGTELRSHLQRKLPDYMVPSAYVMLKELPLTPGGKLDRKALPAPAAERLGREDSRLAPRDHIELQLARIWESLLGIQGVSVRDNFFDLGGHSLLGVQLMSRVKQQFGRGLPLGSLLQNPTIEGLARALRQDAAGLRLTPLVAIRPGGSRPPLFCVHPVGGNVMCYAELARQLGPEQPFYAFQLTEPEDDTEPHTIEAMAARYLEHLREAQPHGPYRLGGWSMGGVIAFEMARRLTAQGRRVELLALIDSFAPPITHRHEDLDDHVLAGMFVEDLEGISGSRLDFPAEDYRRAGPDGAFELLLERARASGMVPVDFGLSELRGLFNLYRKNIRAAWTYRPQEYAGKVTLFRSTASASERGQDGALGWGRFAKGGVEVHDIEGDHYSIVTGAPVRLLAARLGEVLDGEKLRAGAH